MRVSVIVPTYGREALLCQTVEDVLGLDWPDYEVIVVDQSERHAAETEAYLARVAERLVHVRHRPPGVVGALNRGLGLARGEVVLLLDDDVRIPDRRLIADHVTNYTDPAIGGVAGRVLDADHPVEGTYDPRAADPVWGFFHSGWTHGTRYDATTAPGANVSFRRAVLLEVGGLDERLIGNAFRWENDLCLRVRARGHRVIYDPRPTLHHFYGSPGGNENRHLHGRAPGSHRWYRDFFHNHVYVALKHMPRRSLGPMLWRLYRGHVLNRPYAREGARFLAARHGAFHRGLLGGWRSYRGWRAGTGRPAGARQPAGDGVTR